MRLNRTVLASVPSLLTLFGSAQLLLLLRTAAAFSVLPNKDCAAVPSLAHNRRQGQRPDLALSSSSVSLGDKVSSALKKPSKTLAVVLDVQLVAGERPQADEALSDSDVDLLSMQLRKAKASALVTCDWQVAKILASEQATAAGSFPGPCPVLFNSAKSEDGELIVAKAVEAGVHAAILPVKHTDGDSEAPSTIPGVDVFYRVTSVKDVEAVPSGCGFVVTAAGADDQDSSIEQVMKAIPAGSVVIASIESMQEDNNEIEQGKSLKQLGATAVLLEQAVVGDGEDLEYANFVQDGLTKKKSSTFNMSGLTGSTNGHFGGVASSTVTTWLRKKREQE